MKINRFEEIIAWQKSRDLTIIIYKLFKNNRDFSFKDQIQRACLSVMNNIAEGIERNSNKELRNYLYIAKGSCGEVRSMLFISQELDYVTKEEYEKLYNDSIEISRLLSGFIKTLN